MQTEEKNVFAPLCGFVINSRQIYILETKDYLIFCDKQKNCMNLLVLNNLLDVMGLVYDGECFQFVDYFKSKTILYNVWFINKQGKIILKEQTVWGYCRLSPECIIVNSPLKSYDSCNNAQKHPQYVIKDSKIIGYYLGTLNTDYHIIGDTPEYCKIFTLINNSGEEILTSEKLAVKSNNDTHIVLGWHYDYNNEHPYNLNIWNTKTKEIKKIPWLNSHFDIKEKTEYIVVYSEKRQYDSYSNELCLCVINSDNNILFNRLLYNCHFYTLLKEGILISKFSIDFESEYNEYDNETNYYEVTQHNGFDLLTYLGKHIGYSRYLGNEPSERYITYINKEVDNRYTYTEEDLLEGILDIQEDNVVIPPIYRSCEIITGAYVLVVDPKRDKSILYNGELLCFDVDDYTTLNRTCKDENDEYYNKYLEGHYHEFLIIKKGQDYFLYHVKKFIAKIESDNVALISYPRNLNKDEYCWFKIRNKEGNMQGLLNDNGLYIPLQLRDILFSNIYGSQPLIGIKGDTVYKGNMETPFIDNDNLQFITLCCFPTIVAFNNNKNGSVIFYDENKRLLPFVTKEDDMTKKKYAAFKDVNTTIFDLETNKFEEVSNEEDDYYNPNDDYDYDEATYYALGGDDYDTFKENGGSIDDMMDSKGF